MSRLALWIERWLSNGRGPTERTGQVSDADRDFRGLYGYGRRAHQQDPFARYDFGTTRRRDDPR